MYWNQLKQSYSDKNIKLPLILTAPKQLTRLETASFLKDNRQTLLKTVSMAGAVILRGMGKDSVVGNQQILSALSNDEMMSYVGGGGAERDRISKGLIQVTPFPKFLSIPMHNELAYTKNIPDYLCFFCSKVPKSGGETSLANGENVHKSINPYISERFSKKGIIYKRFMFNQLTKHRFGVRKTWQETFLTDNKNQVESLLEKDGIEYRWSKDGLSTRLHRPATNFHPITNNPVWFNNILVFGQHHLIPRLFKKILFAGHDIGPEYGDGSPIDSKTFRHIDAVIKKNIINEPWHVNDILLIDNIACMHGRASFRGERGVTLGMFKAR